MAFASKVHDTQYQHLPINVNAVSQRTAILCRSIFDFEYLMRAETFSKTHCAQWATSPACTRLKSIVKPTSCDITDHGSNHV